MSINIIYLKMAYLKNIVLIVLTFLISSSVFGQKVMNSPRLIAEINDKSLLSQVVGLDMMLDNNGGITLYVADVFTPSVLVMEKKGHKLELINRLGREGRGPDEFIEITSLSLLSQNNLLVVYDRNLERVTLFDVSTQEGQSMFNLDWKIGEYFPMEFYTGDHSDSLLYARKDRFFSDDFDPKNQRNLIIQSYDFKGKAKTDSIFVKPSNDAYVFRRKGSMSVNPDPEWGRKSIFRFRNGRIYYTWTDKSEIDIYTMNGELSEIVKVELPRVEMTEDDKKRIIDLEALLMGKRKSLLRHSLLRKLPKNYWPWIQDFWVDEKGRLWVALPTHLKNKKRDWRIFDSNGILLHEIQLPINFTVHQVKNNYVAGELFNFNNFRSIIQIYKVGAY